MQVRVLIAGATVLAFLSVACSRRQEAVTRQLSPGVFAREPSPAADFVHPNQGFVVMSDRVVVIDPGSSAQARDLLAEIRSVTDKPVLSVLLTHPHGDHIDGAHVFADLGAEIIGAGAGRREFEGPARRRFERARKSRPAIYQDARFAPPTRYFDDRFVIEDSMQRLEFLHLGHAHTPGDAVAWLPRAGVLFTGDVCDNGPYSTLNQGDSRGWIAVLDDLIALGPDRVVPGHGTVSDGQLLELQRRYFVELRAAVREGLGQRKSAEQIAAELDLPFYLEWTGTRASTRVKDVAKVFVDLGGRLPPKRPPFLSRRKTIVLALIALVGFSAVLGLVAVRRRRGRK